MIRFTLLLVCMLISCAPRQEYVPIADEALSRRIERPFGESTCHSNVEHLMTAFDHKSAWGHELPAFLQDRCLSDAWSATARACEQNDDYVACLADRLLGWQRNRLLGVVSAGHRFDAKLIPHYAKLVCQTDCEPPAPTSPCEGFAQRVALDYQKQYGTAEMPAVVWPGLAGVLLDQCRILKWPATTATCIANHGIAECGDELSEVPRSEPELLIAMWLGQVAELFAPQWTTYPIDESVQFCGRRWRLNTTKLECDRESITDLSNLAKLPKLKVLQLDDNPITDLRPLSKLVTLEELTLRNTKVTELGPLTGLTSLKSLSLEGNRITDLRPLITLTNLKYLSVGNPLLSTIEALSKLTNLESLYLSGANLSDLRPLSGLTKLVSLGISETKVSDLKPLAKLIALKSLYSTSTKITDLKALTMFPKLEVVMFNKTRISDLGPLADLPNLTRVSLRDTLVSDLRPLRKSSHLQFLFFDNTKVSSLSPLTALTKLRELSCNNTSVADLAPLKGHSDLRQLEIQNTQVSDLSPLVNAKKLWSIDLSGTRVSDAEVTKLRAALPKIRVRPR